MVTIQMSSMVKKENEMSLLNSVTIFDTKMLFKPTNLLCKRPIFYHRTSRTQVTVDINILIYHNLWRWNQQDSLNCPHYTRYILSIVYLNDFYAERNWIWNDLRNLQVINSRTGIYKTNPKMKAMFNKVSDFCKI